MTQAERLSLLRDCVMLWDVDARLVSEGELVILTAPAGRFEIAAVPPDLRPARAGNCRPRHAQRRGARRGCIRRSARCCRRCAMNWVRMLEIGCALA